MKSAVDEFIGDMMAVSKGEISTGQPPRIEPPLLGIGSPTQGLYIEEQANRNLADEYYAVREPDEVAGPAGGDNSTSPVRNAATSKETGLARKDIHKARIIRNAEIIGRSDEPKEISPRVANFRAYRRRVAEELEADAATILLKMREALR